MPWRRPVKKGSFGGHFDDLVRHFSEDAAAIETGPYKRPAELQEKLDIHARLFEWAWEVDSGDSSAGKGSA